MAPSTVVIISIIFFVIPNIMGLIWIHLLGADKRSFSYLTMLPIIVPPIFTGVAFRIGKWLNKGHGISWGCYSEDVLIIQLVLTLLMYFLVTIILLISLVKPSLIGLKNRRNVLITYILSLIYPLSIILLTELIMPVIAGPLGGTCW